MRIGRVLRNLALASAAMATGFAVQSDAAQTAVGRIGGTNPRAGAFLAVYDTADIHLNTAERTAGKDLQSVFRLCGTLPAAAPIATNTAEPAKVFDNLYFLGIPSVSAWAITTSDGIIVIDSLDNPRESQTFIEGGLRKLGLDPNQIKYLIITHAHTDHFGGAQYIADKFHATLVMSETDWGTMARIQPPATPNPNRGPTPRRGTGVPDGFRLTLGDTTVEIVQTPPHTPGAISLIFPVKDGNQQHMVGLWGGIGFNFAQSEANYSTYVNSVDKYAAIAKARGVDVPIANHSNFDNAFQKIAALKTRAAGAPHPFVLGAANQERIFEIQTECAMAKRAELRVASAK
jgi:metallo-beta-lactamase class B